jgi:hypothetical protein
LAEPKERRCQFDWSMLNMLIGQAQNAEHWPLRSSPCAELPLAECGYGLYAWALAYLKEA